MTIVAGRPTITPLVNSLIVSSVSPCTLNQMMLKILIRGNAAIIPPYSGNLLANSVTIPIMVAELTILIN